MPERTVFESVSRRGAVTLPPTASVWEAARVMTAANCGSVLIVDTLGSMSGIVTERDLVIRVLSRALDPQATRVSEVMTRDPYTVLPDMKVSDALLIMMDRGLQNIPIVTRSSKILGVFSERDALPPEVGDAISMAEFADQVNDALA